MLSSVVTCSKFCLVLTVFRYDHLERHKHFQLVVNLYAEIMNLKCFLKAVSGLCGVGK